MEALYAKLYDKYTKLKKNKFSEFDEVNKEQEEKFLNFVSVSEELTQHLRSEIENLQEIVENLRSEITSVRSNKEKECMEYQKLLMEEERKNKELSEEVENLKELIQEGRPRNYREQSGRRKERNTPESAQITTRSMRKRSRQSEDTVETDMVSPLVSIHRKATPEFFKTTYDGSSSSASLTFQSLGEHLLGMKLSINNEGERVGIIVLHPSTGLSFSLSIVNNSTGEDSKLLYKVVTLGTFERVAPEWMRDDIMFSPSMCPIFFGKVARVIKLHC